LRFEYEKTCFILQKSSGYYDERIKHYEKLTEKVHAEALTALKQDNKLSSNNLFYNIREAKNLIIQEKLYKDTISGFMDKKVLIEKELISLESNSVTKDTIQILQYVKNIQE
jgi:hypothetical protein